MKRFSALTLTPTLALTAGLTLLLSSFAHNSNAAATGTSLDGIVAVVNNAVILRSDLQKTVELYARRAKSRGQNVPIDDNFQRQVLSFLIDQKIQLQQAAAIGIRIDETELNDTMRQFAADNNQTLSEFRKAVRASGGDYQQVREELRAQIITQRLHNREVFDRIVVSQQEIDDYLTVQARGDEKNSEYALQRILIALPDGASPEAIAQARSKANDIVGQLNSGADFAQLAIEHSAGSEALNRGDIGTMQLANMPGIYADALGGKPVGTISQPLRTTNGFHILKIASKSGLKRHVVTQFKARHILLQTSAIRDENATRSALSGLRQRIALGDSFADLARSHSEDANTAPNGGELPWINPGSMPRTFEKIVGELPPREVSEPFRTPAGWHIVEVLEQRKQDQTENLLAARARNAVRQRKAREEQELWLRRLRAEAYIEYRVAALAPAAAQN